MISSLWWICSFYILSVSALLNQDTIYDYQNKTLYIYLHDDENYPSLNKVFKIPFNTEIYSGDIMNSTIASPPDTRCEIVNANSNLYSFCPSSSAELKINKYSPLSNSWSSIELKTDLPYYNGSNYLYTDSDTTGIYIFSGYDEKATDVSNQMLRIDLNTLELTNATSQVQPDPFYGSTTLQINTNTVALFGGISQNDDLISIVEIPVWQYNSWAERPCTIQTTETMESRVDAVMLPVFYETNQFLYNVNITEFQVSSVLLLGGSVFNDNNETVDATPQIASLNVSTNVWQWADLSSSLILGNENNKENGVELSIDSIAAAAMIYDTLITLTPLELLKRSDSGLEFDINLYNITTMKYLSKVDYTYLKESKTQAVHANKNIEIALSAIIPVLVIIIVACFVTWLYKKYQHRKQEEQNEKEIREIVDFYGLQHKQHSDVTFSSCTDSTYKSGGSEFSDPYKTDDYYDGNRSIPVNYTPTSFNGDDLSLNSWRKKREEFEKQKYFYGMIKPQLRHSNSLTRSLSVASNFISSKLKRNNSTQSSLGTFFTAKSDVADEYEPEKKQHENPFTESYKTESEQSLPLAPPPSVPRHSVGLLPPSFPNRTNSTLNHIPEESSLSTFHSQNLGYISMKQAYANTSSNLMGLSNGSHNNSSTIQYQYMNQMGHQSPHVSIASSYSGNRSHSLTSGSSKRPISIMSISTIGANAMANPFNSNHVINEECEDIGSINNEDFNNLEVQVLVGSKRRSKLRVVNPDDDIVDSEIEDYKKSRNSVQNIDTITDLNTNEKIRCSSTDSNKQDDDEGIDNGNNGNNVVRKRVISDENHDQSFMELQ